jgi:phosphoribosyl 1,2-cyclic phosphodiesterase
MAFAAIVGRVSSPAHAAARFSVRFWGVRGSIACSGPRTARYGGNTSSLEVRCDGRLLLFDAGTGIRYLGKTLEGKKLDTDLFFTHTHFDHVCGLPFFRPFFESGNRFRLWAGHLDGRHVTLKRVLSEFMMSPLFPVPPEIFHAQIEYRDFKSGDTLRPAPGITLKTAPLNHPDGATGYRIEYAGKSLCYLTDTEHVPGKPDRNILDLIAGADLVVYDCMYTDEEYPRYATWGHSTWQEGVRLCREAGAKRLVVFHHDPEHDDDMLDGIAREVEKALPGSVVAREGLVLEP